MTLMTSDMIDELLRDLQQQFEVVQPNVRPTTAADLQERLWEFRARLEELLHTQELPNVPLVTQPKRLPRALNPLYFTHRSP